MCGTLAGAPARVQVRCLLEILPLAVPFVELGGFDGGWGSRAIGLMRDWLAGIPVSGVQWSLAEGALEVLCDLRDPIDPTAREASRCVAWTVHIAASGTCPYRSAGVIARHLADTVGHRYSIAPDLLYNHWATRCRQVLPIRDVATAVPGWDHLAIPLVDSPLPYQPALVFTEPEPASPFAPQEPPPVDRRRLRRERRREKHRGGL